MKVYPRFQQYTDFIDVANDDFTIAVAQENIDHPGTEAFLNAHPEYYRCDENAKLLEAWLYLHGDLPFTRWKLEIGLRDRQADGLLKAAPPVEPPGVDRWAGITLARTAALAEYVPSDQEAAQLAKLKDDVDLNDRQRQARLRKLALLAGAQRRASAAPRRPDDRDPQIVI